MRTKIDASEARRYAFIALAILLLERVVVSCLFMLKPRAVLFQRIPAIAVVGFVFSWVAPSVVAYAVEKRDLASLGLSIPSAPIE